jgi:nitroimidazol reductase NimA-like FMN-containing flavoprotein (pyridoxamine 5'-phosphate oxidase superfamily)
LRDRVRHARRADRDVTEREVLAAILARAAVGRLCVIDSCEPDIVPLSVASERDRTHPGSQGRRERGRVSIHGEAGHRLRRIRTRGPSTPAVDTGGA